MSRDHYNGVRKKRHALIDADGNLEALDKSGKVRVIYGTADLVSGYATVSGSRFSADGYAFVSAKFPYPTTDGLSWGLTTGVLTISGAAASNDTVAYQVIIP